MQTNRLTTCLRLYYNKDTGEPIAYSMEELEGDFIIITKEQYAEGRYLMLLFKTKR